MAVFVLIVWIGFMWRTPQHGDASAPVQAALSNIMQQAQARNKRGDVVSAGALLDAARTLAEEASIQRVTGVDVQRMRQELATKSLAAQQQTAMRASGGARARPAATNRSQPRTVTTAPKRGKKKKAGSKKKAGGNKKASSKKKKADTSQGN